MPGDSNIQNKSSSRTSLHAAIQINANAAPTADRLTRAEQLVAGAAAVGGQMILLPECFNTVYTYSEENHARVERIDGPTATWLCETAVRLNIHIAGLLRLLEQGDVYNTLLLFAHDGRLWRYDKNHPWGYEQAYFRTLRRDPNVTIAETDLSSIGMLICWYVSHLDLWQSYTGKVDLMLISICPIDFGHAQFFFRNGDFFMSDDLGSRAEVELDLSRTTPRMPQPATPIPTMSYLFSDRLLPAIVKPVYRKVQRLWHTT